MKKLIITLCLLFLTTFAYADKKQGQTDFISAPTVAGTAVQYGAINLAGGSSEVTGALPTGNGGTGVTANANAANGIVVLDANAKLPAVDGSQLTTIPNKLVFTANGTFVAPAGVTAAYVSSTAGGAGGGGGRNDYNAGGGGGGAGAWTNRKLLRFVPGSSYSITIGSAGTGGLGVGNCTSGCPCPGTSGTASTIAHADGTLTMNGGSYGNAANCGGYNGAGGAGGTGTGALTGGSGTNGYSSGNYGAPGGRNGMGYPGQRTATVEDASGYGNGGSGGGNNGGRGGNGTPGIVIIEWGGLAPSGVTTFTWGAYQSGATVCASWCSDNGYTACIGLVYAYKMYDCATSQAAVNCICAN